MKQAWLPTTAAALLAVAAFAGAVTDAGARDGGHGHGGSSTHVSSGGPSGRSFSSGGPSGRSFSGAYSGRSYNAPARQFSGNPTVRNYNNGPTVRHFNGNGPKQFSGGPAPQYRNYNGNKHVAVHHRRFRGGPVYIFGYGPDYALYANDQCYQYQQVSTPYGWQFAWVNVCADYGYYDDDY